MSKRSIIKPVRFSPDELKAIEEKAAEMKMTTSKFIRTMALDGEAYMLEVPEYRNVMIEMSRIGNNFNQIARRLNEQGSFYYDDFAEIKKEHDELCRTLSQYLSTLRLNKV